MGCQHLHLILNSHLRRQKCKVKKSKINYLPTYRNSQIDTLVSEFGNFHGLVGELSGVRGRSQAMCAHYPGNGAAYVKHTDNHCEGMRIA